MPVDPIDALAERIIKNALTNMGKTYKALDKDLQKEILIIFSKYTREHGNIVDYEELVKYNRLNKMKQQVAELIKNRMGEVNEDARQATLDAYKAIYSESIKQATFDAPELLETKLSVVPPTEKVMRVINTPVTGLTLNDRLENHRAEIILRINETLTRGIYHGDAYRDMAKDLSKVLEDDYIKATRIVRTEGHRIQETARSDSLQEVVKRGYVVMKWWDAGTDERTRESHYHMADKYSKENAIPFDMDFENDMTGGSGPYPGELGTPEDDINCRCHMRTFIEGPGGEQGPGEDELMFPEDGFNKTYQAEEWAEQKYPHIGFDFAGANIETINPSLQHFDQIAQRYPEVTKRLQYVGTFKDKKKLEAIFGRAGADMRLKLAQKMFRTADTWAFATQDGRTIGLNPKAFKDAAKLKSDLLRTSTNGFHPSGCSQVESIISHEYGHHVLNYMERADNVAYVRHPSAASGRGIVQNAFKDFIKTNPRTASVSRYATTNEREMFAEAFSAQHLSPSSNSIHTLPYMENQKKLLGLLEKPVYQPGEWRWIHDIPDEKKREAARKALDEIWFNQLGGLGKA